MTSVHIRLCITGLMICLKGKNEFLFDCKSNAENSRNDSPMLVGGKVSVETTASDIAKDNRYCQR